MTFQNFKMSGIVIFCQHSFFFSRSLETAVRLMSNVALSPQTPTLGAFFFAHTSTFQSLDKPGSQIEVVHSPPRFLPSIFIAHRVQQFHCSSILHRVLPTHALALSASQFVNKKKTPRINASMHSGGFELTKLTYTRPEDNLIRHRGDRPR